MINKTYPMRDYTAVVKVGVGYGMLKIINENQLEIKHIDSKTG